MWVKKRGGLKEKRKKPPNQSGPRRSAYPELDQVEGVLRTLGEELLQAPLLLGELVVDLPDVHALQQGVAVAGAALVDVHKQVLVVLMEG